MKSSVDFRLYLVTDRRQVSHGTLLSALAQFIASGGRAIQLRERDLNTREQLELIRAVERLSQAAETKLFINDRVDLTAIGKADGVHLRETSLPVPAARRIVGSDRLIGVSVHSEDGVAQAEAQGADFAVLGPIYETPSKREYGPPLGLHILERACRRVRIPVFAIGGMSASRAAEVRAAGAFGLAVISYILSAPDVGAATRELLSAVDPPDGRSP
jgi:thiamine-phosphate pyrophosphorylase